MARKGMGDVGWWMGFVLEQQCGQVVAVAVEERCTAVPEWQHVVSSVATLLTSCCQLWKRVAWWSIWWRQCEQVAATEMIIVQEGRLLMA